MTNWVNPWLACDLSTWLRLLLPHWRQLHSRLIPVALAITAHAAMNTLLSPLQRGLVMLLERRGGVSRDPLFVIGHWRSGTTVLHHLLSLDKQFTYPNNYVCFTPHHFLLSEWLLQSGFDWLVPPRRPMDCLPLGAQDPQEDEFALLGLGAPSPYSALAFPQGGLRMAAHVTRDQADKQLMQRWQRKMSWLIRALQVRQHRRVLLKSPPHTWRIPSLLAMYPDAQFVCLTRSPEDTVASTVAMWKSLTAAYALGGTADLRWEQAAIDDYVDFQRTLIQIRGLLEPTQYQEIAFERLLEDPLTTMRQLYRNLKLGDFDLTSPTTIRYLQAIKAHQPQSHSLSASTRQSLKSRMKAADARDGH